MSDFILRLVLFWNNINILNGKVPHKQTNNISHDITEVLLKVALNTITITPEQTINMVNSKVPHKLNKQISLNRKQIQNKFSIIHCF